MKRKGIILAITALFFIGQAHAQNYKTAVGVRLSSDAIVDNSITFKHFIGQKSAVEVLFSFGDPVAIGALLEKHNSITGNLDWLYGGGAYVGFGRRYNFGGMGILGLDYKFPVVPINVTLDWKPELNLIRDVTFEPGAVGLSVRFTFK